MVRRHRVQATEPHRHASGDSPP